MKLESSAFENNQRIPAKYTCDGDDINPYLKISEVPANAKSLLLIMDDPDAPAGTWIHWTMWNIDPKNTEISEGIVPSGVVEGITSSGRSGYSGPCPPSGTHRYYFKLYALDAELDLGPETDFETLKQFYQSHVLEKCELMGLYGK